MGLWKATQRFDIFGFQEFRIHYQLLTSLAFFEVLFFLKIYLSEREWQDREGDTERKILHPLVHSPKAPNSLGEARRRLEASDSAQASPVVLRISTWAITPPGRTSREPFRSMEYPRLEPDTLIIAGPSSAGLICCTTMSTTKTLLFIFHRFNTSLVKGINT